MTILFGVWLGYNVIMFLISLYFIIFGIRIYKARKGLTIFLLLMGLFGIFRVMTNIQF